MSCAEKVVQDTISNVDCQEVSFAGPRPISRPLPQGLFPCQESREGLYAGAEGAVVGLCVLNHVAERFVAQ